MLLKGFFQANGHTRRMINSLLNNIAVALTENTARGIKKSISGYCCNVRVDVSVDAQQVQVVCLFEL